MALSDHLEVNFDSRAWHRILSVLIVINLIIPILFVTAPIGLGPEADALDYRLPLIQWALAHKAYPNFYWTVVDDYPAFGELLMALFRPLAEWGPRIVGVAGYLFFVLGSWRLGKMLLPRIWALIGTLLICSAHLLIIQDNLVMLDVFASSMTLWSSIYLLQEWTSEQTQIGNFWKAGLLGGIAVATRYSQVPPLMVLSLFSVCIVFRKRANPPTIAKSCLAFALPIVLLISPWLIRNLIVNQNPFFPLAVPLFGGKFLDLARYREFMMEVNNYGMGSSPKELLLLFYRFAFFKEIFDYSVGPLPLAFLPWVLVFGWLSWRKPKNLAPLFLYFIFIVAWFYSSKQSRFMIHTLPYGVFSGLLGMHAWGETFKSKKFQSLLVSFLILMGLVGTLKHAHKHKFELPSQKVKIAQKDIPEWLNANATDGKVLLYRRTGNLFAIKEDFVFAYPHPYCTSLFDYRKYSDARKYYQDLYEEGVRYLYLDSRSDLSWLPVITGSPVLKMLYSGKTGGVIYELEKI